VGGGVEGDVVGSKAVEQQEAKDERAGGGARGGAEEGIGGGVGGEGPEVRRMAWCGPLFIST